MELQVRTKKFMSNPLLQRKQFVVEVAHPNAAPLPIAVVREQLASLYKISNINRIVVGGFTTKFGSRYSYGFGHIYDTSEAAIKFEKNFRLARLGIVERKKKINRRQKKDIRIKQKKVRGVAKAKIGGQQK